MDLDTILSDLGARRPVFHSEADFQHALAWTIQSAYPAAQVRLEYPLRGLKGRAALDIVVRESGVTTAIEVKYCKAQLTIEVSGEAFQLPSTVARDLFRHDVCKDIWRLEYAIGTGQADRGVALVLSNDPGLWSDTGFDSIDRQFKIHHGQTLTGTLTWSDRANGTQKNREQPIQLAGHYAMEWRPYSDLGVRNGRFQMLEVPVSVGAHVAEPPGVPDTKPAATSVAKPASIRGRYEALRDAILAKGDGALFSLEEIEAIVGPLPNSARRHVAWWHHVGSHSHALWEHHGYKASPNLAEGYVRFKRS